MYLIRRCQGSSQIQDTVVLFFLHNEQLGFALSHFIFRRRHTVHEVGTLNLGFLRLSNVEEFEYMPFYVIYSSTGISSGLVSIRHNMDAARRVSENSFTKLISSIRADYGCSRNFEKVCCIL